MYSTVSLTTIRGRGEEPENEESSDRRYLFRIAIYGLTLYDKVVEELISHHSYIGAETQHGPCRDFYFVAFFMSSGILWTSYSSLWRQIHILELSNQMPYLSILWRCVIRVTPTIQAHFIGSHTESLKYVMK